MNSTMRRRWLHAHNGLDLLVCGIVLASYSHWSLDGTHFKGVYENVEEDLIPETTGDCCPIDPTL